MSPILTPKASGYSLIRAERLRQIQVEGWTIEHDLGHSDQELAVAACCYLVDVIDGPQLSDDLRRIEPAEWPWPAGVGGCWWKPTPGDPVRQLVKAGALIAAEIDRLLSEAAK